MAALLLAGTASAQGAAALSDRLASGTPDAQKAALEEVLARPAATASIDLFLASAVALQQGRVEDAGFLLYAAQLRARVDLDRFPPKGKGGDSPETLIAALSMQVGQAVNPALMREPKAFGQAVARLRAWDAIGPAAYDPGWEHGPAKPAAQVKAVADRLKQETLEPAENMVKLLGTPEYLEAFKTLQDFNLDPSAGEPSAEKIAAAQKAERTMAEIEKRLGIPGFAAAAGAAEGSGAPPPPADTPAASRASQPAKRVGGAIAEPKRVKFVAPSVPPDLPKEVPRTVILELTVDETGRVRDASVLRGHPAVDRAVAQAVSQWVYEPALEYGKPVPVIFTVTVNLN
jgi:TonB family protein